MMRASTATTTVFGLYVVVLRELCSPLYFCLFPFLPLPLQLSESGCPGFKDLQDGLIIEIMGFYGSLKMTNNSQ
jgi:hypothetical protein